MKNIFNDLKTWEDFIYPLGLGITNTKTEIIFITTQENIISWNKMVRGTDKNVVREMTYFNLTVKFKIE